MTAPIPPVGAVNPILSATPVTKPDVPSPATPTGGTDFASVLGKGLDAVSAAQTNADSLAVQAATGALTDPAQLTIATTQAALMTQLATTVQSKAVAAFNQIMGMQA